MEELLPAETFVVLTKKVKICNFIVYEVFLQQRVYSLSNHQKVTYQCSVGSFRLVHSTWMRLSICTCSGVTMSTSFHFCFLRGNWPGPDETIEHPRTVDPLSERIPRSGGQTGISHRRRSTQLSRDPGMLRCPTRAERGGSNECARILVARAAVTGTAQTQSASARRKRIATYIRPQRSAAPRRVVYTI